jgi:hypothetical protein
LELNKENMKTREEILDNKFKERGIRKGWIDKSRQAVLDAMEEYADEKLRLYDDMLSLQDRYKNEPTEYPQYEDDGKTEGDTDNEQLSIANVSQQREQLLALAQYMCEHQNNLDGNTAKDYLQDFLSQ